MKVDLTIYDQAISCIKTHFICDTDVVHPLLSDIIFETAIRYGQANNVIIIILSLKPPFAGEMYTKTQINKHSVNKCHKTVIS